MMGEEQTMQSGKQEFVGVSELASLMDVYDVINKQRMSLVSWHPSTSLDAEAIELEKSGENLPWKQSSLVR